MERKGIAPDPITGQGDSRTLSPAPDRGVPEAPAVAERDKALLDLVRQYRSDLIRPPAPDSKERRIQLIDKTLAKYGSGE